MRLHAGSGGRRTWRWPSAARPPQTRASTAAVPRNGGLSRGTYTERPLEGRRAQSRVHDETTMGNTPVSPAQATGPGGSRQAACLTDPSAGGQLRIQPHGPLSLALNTTVGKRMTTAGKTPEDGPGRSPRLRLLRTGHATDQADPHTPRLGPTHLRAEQVACPPLRSVSCFVCLLTVLTFTRVLLSF